MKNHPLSALRTFAVAFAPQKIMDHMNGYGLRPGSRKRVGPEVFNNAMRLTIRYGLRFQAYVGPAGCCFASRKGDPRLSRICGITPTFLVAGEIHRAAGVAGHRQCRCDGRAKAAIDFRSAEAERDKAPFGIPSLFCREKSRPAPRAGFFIVRNFRAH